MAAIAVDWIPADVICGDFSYLTTTEAEDV